MGSQHGASVAQWRWPPAQDGIQLGVAGLLLPATATERAAPDGHYINTLTVASATATRMTCSPGWKGLLVLVFQPGLKSFFFCSGHKFRRD
jgi:hypothetical protein